MVRVFLAYKIRGRVERVRAEKETQMESFDFLYDILANLQKNEEIAEWHITNKPERNMKINDYLLME